MTFYFLAKLLSATGIVLGLSFVTERISPRAAGVLAGLPLGAAIVIFFIGIEQGTTFASQAALAMVLGLTASLVFLYCYWFISSRYLRQNSIISIALTSIFSLVCFLIASFVLSFVAQIPVLMTGITVIASVGSIFLFRRIPNIKVEKRRQLSLGVLLMRALITVSIVVLITAFARSLGAHWSGLLAGFPITLFPLLIIIHKTYSANHVWSIIKNFPLGIGSLVIYGICVSLLYPKFGVSVGTLLSMLASILYIAAIGLVARRKL